MSFRMESDAAEKALRSEAKAKNLDHRRVKEFSGELEQAFAVGIDFINHTDDAVRAKARTGHSDPEAERQVVKKGRDAIKASRKAEKMVEEFVDGLKKMGLEEAVNRHIPTIFKNFDDNETCQAQVARCRELGAREESIQYVRNQLAKDDFNVLRFGGADGTIGGLRARARTTETESFVDNVEKQGLPTIMGQQAIFAAVYIPLIVLAVFFTIASFFK